jgi:hypothetical protein
MLALTYPHIEKSDDQPAHLQRLPHIQALLKLSWTTSPMVGR